MLDIVLDVSDTLVNNPLSEVHGLEWEKHMQRLLLYSVFIEGCTEDLDTEDLCNSRTTWSRLNLNLSLWSGRKQGSELENDCQNPSQKRWCVKPFNFSTLLLA